MSSYRKQVAQAFSAVLTGKTVAEARVFTKLDRPLTPADLPAIAVYASEARRGAQDYGNSLIPRVLTVTVEGAVRATPEAALDGADDLVDAIEALIEADPSLGNVVNNTRWQRSITDVTSMGRDTIGVCLLQYEVEMLTNVREPDAFGVGDDGFSATPAVVFTLPDTTAPAGQRRDPRPEPGMECGPDGCAPDAWGGEVKKTGELL
jgi:hypothetical protein